LTGSVSAALPRLVEALAASLAAAPDAAGFGAALAAVPPTGAQPSALPFGLPVCAHWGAALAAAAPASLAGPLAVLGPALAWSQNPNYRRRPPDATFLDNYGYAVIAGPSAGAPALVVCERLALGVLLLGPRTHYPRHAHPAAELYLPLNAAEWWKGEGPWTAQPAGAVIHHPPNLPHATRTGEGPLLAIYLWRGDLATPARIASSRD
jgi:hypothetical protein